MAKLEDEEKQKTITNCWIKEKIKAKIREYLENNSNKNIFKLMSYD